MKPHLPSLGRRPWARRRKRSIIFMSNGGLPTIAEAGGNEIWVKSPQRISRPVLHRASSARMGSISTPIASAIVGMAFRNAPRPHEGSITRSAPPRLGKNLAMSSSAAHSGVNHWWSKESQPLSGACAMSKSVLMDRSWMGVILSSCRRWRLVTFRYRPLELIANANVIRRGHDAAHAMLP